MNDRISGIRKNTGLVLMTVGIASLIVFVLLSLGEVTTVVAWVSRLALITGLVTFVTGAGFYLLARSRLL